MRRLVGADAPRRRRIELPPQPGLDGLESLLEDVRRAGLAAQLRVDGEPFPLPIDLSPTESCKRT
jgi:hypothetical protein